jgi:UDP-N-acetylglucosamine acyltransferase
MDSAHVGHDNIIGNEVTINDYVALGGHVQIDDYANIGGVSGVHQFSKIGKYVMVEMLSKIQKDVPPFVLAARVPTRYVGLNTRGLTRRGFTSDRIEHIKDAYRILYDSGLNVSDAVQRIQEDLEMTDDIKEILNFIKNSSRGIIRK